MDKVITIVVCDHPQCNATHGLAPCAKCGKKVCAQHRFEGDRRGKAVFVCWMDMPISLG